MELVFSGCKLENMVFFFWCKLGHMVPYLSGLQIGKHGSVFSGLQVGKLFGFFLVRNLGHMVRYFLVCKLGNMVCFYLVCKLGNMVLALFSGSKLGNIVRFCSLDSPEQFKKVARC